MLALIGGIVGMFVLFGVAWKLVQPSPEWELLGDEIGPPEAWRNEPTLPPVDSPPPTAMLPAPNWPTAQETVAYSVPPPVASAAAQAWPQWPEPSRRPPVAARRAPPSPPPPPRSPVPADDLDGAATQFFDRALLAEVEANIDRTEILAEDAIAEPEHSRAKPPTRKTQFYSPGRA
ncbi:hypothetical protein ACNOYE_00565 [Nannocystaceae bacterium ST9]